MAVSTTIRMYRLMELGDCFLITFAVGANKSHVLIDCGSFRNSSKSIAQLQKITKDVAKTLDGQPLNVLVGTHQHNDHLSGFVHCEDAFRNRIAVEEVWLSWLDDPMDKAAQGIGEAHHNLTRALFDASKQLHASPLRRKGLQAVERLDDLLAFHGAKGTSTPPELPAEAIRILKSVGKKEPKYLRPGDVEDMPGLPADSVRIYVLGPPQNSDLLYRKDPRKGESYDHALATAGVAAGRFLDAVSNRRGVVPREEEQYPFSEQSKKKSGAERSTALKKLIGEYDRRNVAWRRIDDDWTQQAETLALFLNTYTNNSSLVLAFELVASRKILLFAADAQTGNWISWPDVQWKRAGVNIDDLLARTVFYKVGHHGSHNATLVATLEKMKSKQLVAMIPVHKEDPNITKDNGWKMPARNLFKRLQEKTANRVLMMDGVHPATCDPGKSPAKASWNAIGIKPKITPLFIELQIP